MFANCQWIYPLWLSETVFKTFKFLAFTTCSCEFHNFFFLNIAVICFKSASSKSHCLHPSPEKKQVFISFFKLLTVIQISIIISSSCPFFQAQESSRKYSSHLRLRSSSLPFCGGTTSTPFTWWGNQNHIQDTRWRNPMDSDGTITFLLPLSVPLTFKYC